MLEREGVALPRSEQEPESADPQVHWKGRVDGQHGRKGPHRCEGGEEILPETHAQS